MNSIDASWLGLVQGITEFLPISSSGHLYLMETWLGLTPSFSLEVLLHIASLAAVILYFYKDIFMCFAVLLQPWRDVNEFINREPVQLIIATLCTVPIALIIKDIVPLSITLVGVTLLLTAGLVWWSDRSNGTQIDLTLNQVLVVGVVQGFAALPGLSRSGLTIAVLLLLGIQAKAATRFSFLLSIPTIFGALVLSIIQEPISLNPPILAGMAVCALVSFGTIHLMTHHIKKYWKHFALYCALAGGALLLMTHL